MPELPELQALAERLHDALHGAIFDGVSVLGFSSLKTVEPPPESLVGRSVERVSRRGKYLAFDAGGPRLVVHLSQGGRIELEPDSRRTRPKGGVLRVTFRQADRPGVLLREHGTERKAGFWVLGAGDEGPMAGLGPDPDDPAFERLLLTATDRRRLHTILRDQRTVAGIGRGYADDILHNARLSPFASLGALGTRERERLRDAVRDVLDRALAAERARTGGLSAQRRDRFSVHGRHGQACPACGDTLRRVAFDSHEVTYCPRCQTGGRVLADRRMSRLLR